MFPQACECLHGRKSGFIFRALKDNANKRRCVCVRRRRETNIHPHKEGDKVAKNTQTSGRKDNKKERIYVSKF